MIGRITGTLIEKHPPKIVVDVGGVGYELDVSMTTFFNLPALGEKVSLHTQLVIREDAHLLFGFGAEAERRSFRELVKVSGIGAKTALSVLSGLSVDDLAAAVAAQEVGRLVRVPGIGKKTAERLLLELKGKLDFAVVALPGAPVRTSDDVRQALLALGYNDKEADLALKQLPAGLSVSEAIRQALKLLSKA
ncbi:MAG TPA: Holliday junction branch migration protein RuvA [Thiobacillaceae bacterium]|nr:Holliday junction branch migration protein RuvA [Thiobacillaceae bacterium]